MQLSNTVCVAITHHPQDLCLRSVSVNSLEADAENRSISYSADKSAQFLKGEATCSDCGGDAVGPRHHAGHQCPHKKAGKQ